MALAGALPAGASAALFPQCPPIDMNAGCQFLVTVTDTETIVESDPTQGPYEGSDDALIGVVNNSSKPLSSLPFSAEIELFGFEFDGICSVTGSPVGCVETPLNTTGEKNEHAGEACTNGASPGFNGCGFPAPKEEEPGLKVAEGAEAVGEAANGDPIYGYEGPTSWFEKIGPFKTFQTGSGVVRFGPAIPPGGTSYFSLESPPAGGFGAASGLTTNLSGGGQSGSSISVVQGTPVTDTATLTAENAATATGNVSFNVYSDSECKTKAAAESKAKLAGGVAGPSAAISTLAPGTYYWQATYTGNLEHQAAASPCGNEILKVLAPTTLTTSLSGGGVSSPTLAVPLGTTVTDQATLAGPLAKTATGSVAYTVYSDSKCTKAVASSAGSVIAGVVTHSLPFKPKVGTYYVLAAYSGDGFNAPSSTTCGSEVLVVALKANLGLPASNICLSKRKFIAHPRAPKGAKIVHVEVFINGVLKSQGALSGGHTTIDLIGLPKGAFRVTMVVTTSTGKKYIDSRTFHTCVKKHKKKKK
jgi:hypothetical protein